MKQIALKWGGLMFLGLTVLFLLFHILHLTQNYHLRVFNGVIHLGCLWYAIREFQARYPDHVLKYTPGVVMGMVTSTVGVVAFSFFITIFLYFSPAFLGELQARLHWEEYLTPIAAGSIIVVEGIVISLIGSYIIVRILEARREDIAMDGDKVESNLK